MLEINARAVYGIRSIGIGFSLLSKLCGFLNMPPPMTQTSCNNMSNIIKAASKSVAEKSISDPAACLRKGEKTADIGVSVDGTWQQKGFSSTLVVVLPYRLIQERLLMFPSFQRAAQDVPVCQRFPSPIQSYMKLTLKHGLPHWCTYWCTLIL